MKLVNFISATCVDRQKRQKRQKRHYHNNYCQAKNSMQILRRLFRYIPVVILELLRHHRSRCLHRISINLIYQGLESIIIF